MLPTVDALTKEIIRQASLYQNLREVKPNAQWDNPATKDADKQLNAQLVECMESAGWEKPWAYCAAFAEGMIILSLRQLGCRPDQYVRLRKLIQPGVMNTVRALSSVQALSAQPAPGSLWLARHGNSANGHAGIVIKARGNGLMSTIEGNTTSDFKDSASDRQGDGVFPRERNVATNGNLKTMGFLTPASMLRLLAA